MNKRVTAFGPAHPSSSSHGVFALIVLVILVLIMLWYVHEAPLPYKFP